MRVSSLVVGLGYEGNPSSLICGRLPPDPTDGPPLALVLCRVTVWAAACCMVAERVLILSMTRSSNVRSLMFPWSKASRYSSGSIIFHSSSIIICPVIWVAFLYLSHRLLKSLNSYSVMFLFEVGRVNLLTLATIWGVACSLWWAVSMWSFSNLRASSMLACRGVL